MSSEFEKIKLAQAQPRPTRAVDSPLRRWRIGDLIGDAREVIIEHGGQDYRLRITANDKLILTK
jgi:hemin uptake protein HemP